MIVDEAKFQRVRRDLIADGPERLKFIADFDRTLTACFTKDGASPTVRSRIRRVLLPSRPTPAAIHARARPQVAAV